MKASAKQSAVQFFYNETPRFYHRDTTQPASNREHWDRAVALANAERWALGEGIEFVWTPDFEDETGEIDLCSETWGCTAFLTAGDELRPIADVIGIGSDPALPPYIVDPNYCRVVAAELAIEVRAHLEAKSQPRRLRLCCAA